MHTGKGMWIGCIHTRATTANTTMAKMPCPFSDSRELDPTLESIWFGFRVSQHYDETLKAGNQEQEVEERVFLKKARSARTDHVKDPPTHVCF